jgi:hypothetical protein
LRSMAFLLTFGRIILGRRSKFRGVTLPRGRASPAIEIEHHALFVAQVYQPTPRRPPSPPIIHLAGVCHLMARWIGRKTFAFVGFVTASFIAE